MTRRISLTAAVLAALGVAFFAAPSAAAADPEPAQRPGVLMIVDQADASDVGVMGTSCTWPACGEVHNRSGHLLMLSRDANSHFSCGDVGPYAVLSSGQSSTRYWPDTDCFAGTDCSVFYAGSWYSPYDYIRIYNPVWVYNVSC